jgi:hypothetical protein
VDRNTKQRNTFNELETRTAIADLIVKFAQQGERDPQKLKALVLAALPSYEAEETGRAF